MMPGCVLLLYNTKNAAGLGLRLSGTAAEVWSSLTSQYKVSSDLTMVTAQRNLHNIMFVDGNDFPTHISSLCTKWGALIDAPLIPARFWSFLQNPAESRGIKFGRDTSQNVIPGDKYSSGMMSFLISRRNGPRNGQKGMQPECNDRNIYY